MASQSNLYGNNVFNEKRINNNPEDNNTTMDKDESEKINVLKIDNKSIKNADDIDFGNHSDDIDPNDSNNIPLDDSDVESSRIMMSHNSQMNTANVSSMSNKHELKSVIYHAKDSNLESSKNPSTLSDSMVQTVNKSPKKGGSNINNNIVLSMLDIGAVKLERKQSNKDIAQYQLYMPKKSTDVENKMIQKQMLYKNVATNINESSFDTGMNLDNNSDQDVYGDLSEMKFLEPVHENVQQVVSDDSSNSSEPDTSSIDNKAPLKGMSAFGDKKNMDDSVISAGPIREANEVFDRIANKNNMSPNFGNDVNAEADISYEKELREKDDILGPFELNRMNNFGNRVQAQSVHITGKSGFSNATTAVDSANNNQANVFEEKIKQNKKVGSQVKHKKDLSTTTPEEIGMKYNEPQRVWDWKPTTKSTTENKTGGKIFNSDDIRVAYNKSTMYKKETKEFKNDTIQNIPNSTTSYLNNNSDDLMNTEYLASGNYAAFKNSRILHKPDAFNYSLSQTDEDAYVSDITHPLNIQGLSAPINYTKEANDIEDESEPSYENNESIIDDEHQDIPNISSKSFDKLTAMLDLNPFELNLSNTDMIDVLENLKIVQELNPYVLKLDLSINEGQCLKNEDSDISKLVHLKELLMCHMRLTDINFLANGTFFHLEHFNLSKNDLSSFSLPLNLHPMISLKSLNLSHNMLSGHLRLDLSRFFPSLEFLNLNGNGNLESIEFILPDEGVINMKKLSLIGLRSLKKMEFFCKNTEKQIEFIIDEIDITKANVSLLKSLKETNNLNVKIKHMKISFSTIDNENNFTSMKFPDIDSLFVKNSSWSTEIFGCLNETLTHLQITNVSFDMGSFENSPIQNNLVNLKSFTITDTNLKPPMNSFLQFIKKNLKTTNLKELNIKENFNIKEAYFSEAKKTKRFRIGTGMIFPKLCKMDDFDLVEIWKDKT